MKKIAFIFIAISAGIFISFLITELGIRLYLFGPKLGYECDRVIDIRGFPRDKKHIFFVGDSFTQGYPFPIDQSYPLILAGKIKNNKIRIANFALTASDLYDEVNIIKQVSELDPSLIVWGLSSNDICTAVNDSRVIGRLAEYNLKSFPTKKIAINHLKNALFDLPYDCIVNAKMNIFSTFKEVLSTYSYTYILIKSRFADAKIFDFIKIKSNSHYELKEISSDLLKYYKSNYYPGRVTEAISYIKEYLSNKKIHFILLYVPQESDLNQKLFEANIRQFDKKTDDYNRENPRKQINEFCLKNNILFIDPSNYMEHELKNRTLFLPFDRHYNYYGNSSLAKFLSENSSFLAYINSL